MNENRIDVPALWPGRIVHVDGVPFRVGFSAARRILLEPVEATIPDLSAGECARALRGLVIAQSRWLEPGVVEFLERMSTMDDIRVAPRG